MEMGQPPYKYYMVAVIAIIVIIAVAGGVAIFLLTLYFCKKYRKYKSL